MLEGWVCLVWRQGIQGRLCLGIQWMEGDPYESNSASVTSGLCASDKLRSEAQRAREYGKRTNLCRWPASKDPITPVVCSINVSGWILNFMHRRACVGSMAIERQRVHKKKKRMVVVRRRGSNRVVCQGVGRAVTKRGTSVSVHPKTVVGLARS